MESCENQILFFTLILELYQKTILENIKLVFITLFYIFIYRKKLQFFLFIKVGIN